MVLYGVERLRRIVMHISYKKLWKLLIDRDMKKKDLRALTGISSNTITKLANNENVTMEVIEKICLGMRCTIDEVVDFIPDDQVDANLRKRANREVLHGIPKL